MSSNDTEQCDKEKVSRLKQAWLLVRLTLYNALKNSIKYSTYLGVAITAAFALLKLFSVFDPTHSLGTLIEGAEFVVLAAGFIFVGLGTFAIYRDDPIAMIRELFPSKDNNKSWREVLRLRNLLALALGFFAALLKGLMTGLAIYLLPTTLPLLGIAVVIPWPIMIGLVALAVFGGICQTLVQQTKLVRESQEMLGLEASTVISNKLSWFQRCLRWPMVIGHGLGQWVTTVFAVKTVGLLLLALLMGSSFALPAPIAILCVIGLMLAAIPVGITTGRFYGKPFLNMTLKGKVEADDRVSLNGVLVGGLSSFCKGALAFISIVDIALFIIGVPITALFSGWFAIPILVVAGAVGVFTMLVQAAKYIPKMSKALRIEHGPKGDSNTFGTASGFKNVEVPNRGPALFAVFADGGLAPSAVSPALLAKAVGSRP